MLHSRFFRALAVLLALAIMTTVYVLIQGNIFYEKFGALRAYPNITFVVSKALRLVLNDIACLFIIWAVFLEKKYLMVAWYLFILELAFIFPAYVVLKLTFEGASEISSPFLSQIHRLVVNPILMFLLIMGFFYQKFKSRTT